MEIKAISLKDLTDIVAAKVMEAPTQNVWITAETQDVAVRGGHCYMELLQKDGQGRQVARVRACCWASVFGFLSRKFQAATSTAFGSGMKVMLNVSVSMHAVYGLSLIVNDIDPDFTAGDLLRRRREILDRLTREGVIEMNRQLALPMVIQRIAVVSAKGAAGYGDFINQLYGNSMRLRFTTRLFEAKMQGETAPRSIIDALDRILRDGEQWDVVVIIRGGGATSDLQAYEDYDLASTVAQYPIPVAIGIGHERDITVLDWVANSRLKTPTAVAEWLVERTGNFLGWLINSGNRILQIATGQISGNKEQLAQAEALLPVAARGVLERGRMRLDRSLGALAGVSASRISPALARLEMLRDSLPSLTAGQLRRKSEQLEMLEKMLEVLSPAATLARGYSITRIDGKAVTSVEDVELGATLEITVADGSFIAHTP